MALRYPHITDESDDMYSVIRNVNNTLTLITNRDPDAALLLYPKYKKKYPEKAEAYTVDHLNKRNDLKRISNLRRFYKYSQNPLKLTSESKHSEQVY